MADAAGARDEGVLLAVGTASVHGTRGEGVLLAVARAAPR